MICSYMISYSIEHLLLFEGCLLGLSLRVCVSFPWGIFTPWVTFIIHLECWEIMWGLYEIFHFLDQSWYTLWVWEMSNLSLKSLNQCLLCHSITNDMIFICCIWNVFIVIIFTLIAFIWFPIISFLLFIPSFIPF